MRIPIFLFIFLLCISCKEKEKKYISSKDEEVKEILVSSMSETQFDTAIIYKIVEHMPRFKAYDPFTLDNNKAKRCSDFARMDYMMMNLRLPPEAKEKGLSTKGVV
ncbi:MAG: hypothetical protein ACI94Y_000313 [Maribacter sp.]|jgi:hypothetical protein